MHKKHILVASLLIGVFSCFFHADARAGISEGTVYLENVQNEDGSWGSDPSLIFFETAEATRILDEVGISGSSYQSGIEFIKNELIAGVEDYSLRINSLFPAGEDVTDDLNQLVDAQNDDGGWGFNLSYNSDVYHTSRVLQALTTAGFYDDDVIGSALSFICSQQNSDGGFGFAENDSSTYYSSVVARTLKEYLLEYQFLQSYIDLASSYLLTQKNPDGSFGIEENKIFETALASRALIAAGKYFEALAIRNYLLDTQNQNGSWGDNVYSTALAIRALKEIDDIDKPNLRVLGSSITISPLHPVDGQRVTIGCMAINTGVVAAEDVEVAFYQGNPDEGGELIGSEIIPLIEPAESSHAEITWVLDGIIGEEEIYVWADPDNEIDEVSEEDNIAFVSITAASKPDLVIAGSDLGFDNTTPLAGEYFTLTTDIHNLGEGAIGHVTVAVYDGYPQASGERLIELTFNSIPGGSVSTALFDLALDAGTYDLHVFIDPDNSIDEANEENNIASRTITVRSGSVEGIDLAVVPGEIGFSTLYPKEGDTVTITSLIRNNGDQEADNVTVVFYDGDPGGGGTSLGDPFTDVVIPAGGVATLNLHTASLASGEHEIYVVADPDDTIVEIDELNNTAHKPLTVLPQDSVIDLAVTVDNISFEPQAPDAGEVVQITCGVTNESTVSVQNIKVRIYEGNPEAGGSLLLPEVVIPQLGAGSNGWITVERDTTGWGGNHEICLVADPENIILEENEDNNKASKTLTVSAPTNPDLAVSEADITFNPPEPVTGDTVTINCIVENFGDEDVPLVDVSFYIGEQLLGNDTAADIPAGGSATASINWDTTGLTGEHTIAVVVDLLNTVEEVNEFNNSAARSITVLSEPYECTDGETRSCSSDCGEGIQTCAGGFWQVCVLLDPPEEICDGIDNDCDGEIDEGVMNTYYLDADNDTYGDPADSVQACEIPEGYVEDNSDCDDSDPEVNPGAEEIPNNGKDDDCNLDTPDGNEKEQAVACGIEWLASHQSAGGAWPDYKVTRNNAYALKAFAASNQTQLPECDLILERLKNLQASNDSWENNTYDTCEVILALLEAGMDPQDPEIQNAVSWIKNAQSTNGSWSQASVTGIAIEVLIKTGEDPASNIIQDAAAWLIDAQIETGADKGCWGILPTDSVPSPYVGPYPVIGLAMATSPDNEAVQKAVNYFSTAPSSWYNVSIHTHTYLEILRHTGGSSAEIIDMIERLVDQQVGYTNPDGGWTGSSRSSLPFSEPDLTGKVIWSLSKCREEYSIPPDIAIDYAVAFGVQFLVNKTTPWGDIYSPYDKTDLTGIAAIALNYSDFAGSYELIENALQRILACQCQGHPGYWEWNLIHLDTPGYSCGGSYAKISGILHSILALGEIPIPIEGKEAAIAAGIQVLYGSNCIDIYNTGIGWGWPRMGDGGLNSDIKTTCWVLLSLLRLGESPQNSDFSRAFDWLMTQRNSNGSFSGYEGTTIATLLLNELGGYDQEVSEAIAWFKDRQKPDGGWGNVYNTSWALIALASQGEAGIEVAQGVNWLLAMQNSDCGWAIIPGIPASNTQNTTLATWALAASEYEPEIDLELTFDKPYYYPGETVTMTVTPLNPDAGDLALSGTVTEYRGEVVPINFIQTGESFEGSHVLSGNHLPGTDIVSTVAIGDDSMSAVTGTFVVKNSEGVLPDLTVSGITFSSDTPVEGESVTITATVSNSEVRDAANVVVRCYDGDPDAGGTMIGEHTFDKVIGLESAEVGFTWQALSGTHEIYVVVDSDDTIPETDEDNNKAYNTIDVSEISFKPDLAINGSDIIVTPSDPSEGEMVTVSAAVYNLGEDRATDVLIRFFDGSPDEPDNQIGEDQMISFLSPGNSEVVEVVWDTLGELGRSYLHVTIDPEDSIEEIKENNNEAIIIVDVSEFSRPDLALSHSDISFAPLTPLEGEEVEIFAEIHNRGKPVQNVKVGFYDGDPESGGILIKEVIIYSTILSGESEIIKVSWDTVGVAEDPNISVVIDPEDMIVEENEGNNKASAGITVESSGLAIEVSLDKVEYEAEEDVSISSVITNLRQEQRVGTFDLHAEDSEGNVISELIISETISLGPTDEVTIDLVWNTGSIKAGQYSIVAVVHENGTPRVTDSDDFIITADLSLSGEDW